MLCLHFFEGPAESVTSGLDDQFVGLAGHLTLEKLVGMLIKATGMAAAHEEIAVCRVLPGPDRDKLGGDLLEIGRSFDGIGDGGEENVGPAMLDVSTVASMSLISSPS